MPFEELVAGMAGKMLVTATNVFDREKSALYIFDVKDTKRVRELLAAERAYVEKKKKGHSLPRLFKKNGVSFESIRIPIDHIIVWDRDETPEAAEPVEEKPKVKEETKEKKKSVKLPSEWAKIVMESMEDDIPTMTYGRPRRVRQRARNPFQRFQRVGDIA